MQTRHAVSPRVRSVIVETEERSEIFISLFQVGFVLFMGVLYFLAPKGYAGNVPIRPVPLVLMVYGPLAVARLILAVRRALTPSLLALSILLDITMICTLIWSFHIQYQQPAGFYLKSPTAMYLFIFIAMRSLRYNWRYVLFAGLTAAAGWAVLTGYALYDDGRITRDFVEYMTGSSILIGAQADHIIALLALSVILAVTVQRSGKVLQTAAAESTAREDLSRYFSPAVVDRILAADGGLKPGEGETEIAAVMSIDLRGFSAWAAQIEPSEVVSVLAEYQSRIVPLVLRHRGSIDKFMGDGILVHFGAFTGSHACTVDAMRAAEDIRNALITWGEEREQQGVPPFGFGIGIASGEIVFGAVGETGRLEFTMIGSPVNLASKLEKHSKQRRAHILVPVQTYQEATQAGFDPSLKYGVLRNETVDGVEHPLDLVAAV